MAASAGFIDGSHGYWSESYQTPAVCAGGGGSNNTGTGFDGGNGTYGSGGGGGGAGVTGGLGGNGGDGRMTIWMW